MILSFYILLNFTVMFIFSYCQKKNLHILEILTYWLIGTLLVQNYSAINVMNFKTFVVSNIPSLALTDFFNRTVLEPIIFIWFLNYYIIFTSLVTKLILITSFVLILVGLEWLADWLGVFSHNHWKLWWSFAVWLISILISIGVMKFFRKMMVIGVQRL